MYRWNRYQSRDHKFLEGKSACKSTFLIIFMVKAAAAFFENFLIMFIDTIQDSETIRERKYWRRIMETLIKHVLLLYYHTFINISFPYHYIFVVINMSITILTINIIFVIILNIVFIILLHYRYHTYQYRYYIKLLLSTLLFWS